MPDSVGVQVVFLDNIDDFAPIAHDNYINQLCQEQ